MSNRKYVAFDVHLATIATPVRFLFKLNREVHILII